MCKATEQQKQNSTITITPDNMSSSTTFFEEMRNVFLRPTTCENQNDHSNVRPCDIICGRGQATHHHIGNKRFRQLIEMNRERYQTAKVRDYKTRVTLEIIELIRSCNGRFLSGELEEIHDENVLREKVSHALRSAKDPNRKRIRKPRKVTVRLHKLCQQKSN